MKVKRTKDWLSLALFRISIALFIFGFGFSVGEFKFFPYSIFALARDGFEEVKTRGFLHVVFNKQLEKKLSWFYKRLDHSSVKIVPQIDQAYPGLNLITRVADSRKLSVDILDMHGHRIHAWDIDWFEIWPNPDHLQPGSLQKKPKSRPGTHIHGAVILENGDLVFNFEYLGLVRLNRSNNVVWRLPYRTHHSIYLHPDGNLWVCGLRRVNKQDPAFPNRTPPYDEYTVLEVSPNGAILKEWAIPEILRKNGLSGLLELNTTARKSVWVLDDRLHLNDAEPFPPNMEEGFFKHGDIIVSLRNINTLFVFNRHSEKVKYVTTGLFIHQHDPDFIDGNTYSVFDNLTASGQGDWQSRIVVVSVPTNRVEVMYEGNIDHNFYSNIMGNHQWLPNGNLLVVDSTSGRAFEINKAREPVWEYVNYVDKDIVGIVEDVQRISGKYAKLFNND